MDDHIARGDFKAILTWLREKIHRQGRRYSAMHLVEHVTGEPLSASHFLNYLKDKFGEIYNINW